MKMIKKYRKKPIVVEAFEYTGEGTFIDTLEGRLHVSKGDFIITGITGEKYPSKPDIFHKTYDLIQEEN